jgi:hypothetical protein
MPEKCKRCWSSALTREALPAVALGRSDLNRKIHDRSGV